jgi:hypothetical protein
VVPQRARAARATAAPARRAVRVEWSTGLLQGIGAVPLCIDTGKGPVHRCRPASG